MIKRKGEQQETHRHDPADQNPAESSPEEQERSDVDRDLVDDTVAGVDARLQELETEVEEWKDKYHRALAERQNFQRRAQLNEREAREQGARRVLESLLGVLDNLDLALGQNLENASAEQILGGVNVIKNEFIRVLDAQGVSRIEPEPGEAFDPQRHEAVVHQPMEGVAPGAVSALLQVGYQLGERVVRPAKVAVAPEGGSARQNDPPASPADRGED
jgi:molecular chaperone GrpE